MEFKPEFIKIESASKKFKASVYPDGRFVFNTECNSYMSLDGNNFFKIAKNSEIKESFFLVESANDSDSFKTYKTGKQFQLKLPEALEILKIDFVKNSYTFSIEKYSEKYGDKTVYLVKKIESKKRNKISKEVEAKRENIKSIVEKK